jgi:hypothetical protein
MSDIEICETHGNDGNDDADNHDDETYPILSYPLLWCGCVCVESCTHLSRGSGSEHEH